MNVEHIELFVDRLCAMFPGVPVSAKALKHTWTKDRGLRAAETSDGKQVLEMCQRSERMPTLGAVTAMFRAVAQPVATVGARCVLCDNTGWVYADESRRSGVRRCGECRK